MHIERLTPGVDRVTGNSAREVKPLRVKDVAAVLGVDSSTVYREIAGGRLKAYRVGTGRGTFRIPHGAFRSYLQARGIPARELGVSL
jgi:excisionase family DNA binding protein